MIKGLFRLVIVLAVFLFLFGCATESGTRGPSYAESLSSRSLPSNDEERIQECSWIRSEIARQQGLAEHFMSRAPSVQYVMLFRAEARNRIAALESRASNVQCTAAFSNSPPASSKQTFDQCFKRCQQYTNRTKEQCFDSCNK